MDEFDKMLKEEDDKLYKKFLDNNSTHYNGKKKKSIVALMKGYKNKASRVDSLEKELQAKKAIIDYLENTFIFSNFRED